MKEVPIVYLALHCNLKRYCIKHGKNNFVLPISSLPREVSDINISSLFKIYRHPKPLHYPILKEMEKYNLVKILNRYEVQILNCFDSCSYLDCPSKITHAIGLW